jgi:hypothetical protein
MKRTLSIVTWLATGAVATAAAAQPAPAEAPPPADAAAGAPAPAEAPAPESTDAVPVTTAAPVEVDAAPEPELAGPGGVQLHGFVSQGGILSTGNEYLAKSKRGSAEFFEAGLNVTHELDSNFRVGLQIFARDLGAVGNYAPTIDWAYIDYRYRPWLGLRFGRVKAGLGLYNQNYDVDVAHTTILLPQSLYDLQFRDVLNAVNGAMVYGNLELGGAGSLDYMVFGGNVILNIQNINYDVKYAAGAFVSWQTPITGLRVAGHARLAAFTGSQPLPPGAPSPTLEIDFPEWRMFGGSIEYANESITATAEYTTWRSPVDYTPDLAPDSEVLDHRAYLQLQWRATERLSLSVYESIFLPKGKTQGAPEVDSSDPGNHQYDTALSLRYDVTPNWLVKAEAHYIDGNANVDLALNGAASRADLEDKWMVFLAKTTVAF